MSRTLNLLIAIGAVLIGISVVCCVLYWQSKEMAYWTEHSQHVLYRQSDLLSAYQDMNLASRGYALSKNPALLGVYKSGIEQERAICEELKQLSRKNNTEQQAVAYLQQDSSTFEAISDRILKESSPDLIEAQKLEMDNLRHKLDTIVVEEKRLFARRQSRANIFQYLSWTMLVAQIIAGIVLLFGAKSALKKYRQESEDTLKVMSIARDEAVAANEAKSRFLSTVSHEVRTPMAGVIGMVEIIHVSAKDDNLRNLSKVALESCKRLLQILTDLLDASKLRAGAVKLEYRFFAVRPIIGDVLQLASREAEKKQLKLAASVDSKIPDLVCGDELRVRQIMQNLVFNAVKFTAQGSIDIRVDLIEQTANATSLKFCVKDTGIGIKDAQKQRLFEPFVQAEDSTTRIYGGTGLGLSICRMLIELMEGEIGVISEVGKGSTFWFQIPFTDDLCQNT